MASAPGRPDHLRDVNQPSEKYGLLSPPINTDTNSSSDNLAQEKQTPVPTGKRSRLSPRVVIPIAVLVIQTALLIFGWGFFGATRQRPIPLPAPLATQVKNHDQSATLVVTLFASFISLVSSFLFERAVRYSLARFLADPVNLFTVAGTIRLANGSPLINRSRLEWTILTGLCLVALNAQTAGWTALLMPKRIILTAPMDGFELDVTSPDFQRLMDTNSAIVTPDLFTSVIPSVQGSGNTAVSTRFGLPSILNFNQISYIKSTNGILPPNYGEMYSMTRSATGSSLPANTRLGKLQSRPAGFPNSFIMDQQGFTANISCVATPMNETSLPSMRLLSQSETIFNASVTLAQLVVGCPNSAVTALSGAVMTSPAIDAVFAVTCPVHDAQGNEQSWDVIFTGSGAYKFINTTVCNVAPQIANLRVHYDDSTKFFKSSYPSFISGSETWDATPAPWIGEYAVSILLRSLSVSQSTKSNNVGDMISSFLTSIPPYPDALNDVLAEYTRGVLEFSITLLRTVYTQNDNRLYPGNNSVIPLSMRRGINGTFSAETIGWYQETDVAPGVFLAPTFILVASIGIVLFTLIRRRGKTEPETNHHFDPGNILHVIAASSAGGLKEPFPSFDVKPYDFAQMVDIRLEPVGEHGQTGFVHVK